MVYAMMEKKTYQQPISIEKVYAFPVDKETKGILFSDKEQLKIVTCDPGKDINLIS